MAAAALSSLQRDTASALSLYLRQATSLDGSALVAAAFAFALGMLHAATPGHGKIVVFSYFFGQDARPWTGVSLSLKIATTHILTAIVLFAAADMTQTIFFGRTAGSALVLQAASYLLIAVIGATLMYRSLRARSPQPRDGFSARALPFVVGLLPCPLTLLILSYAIATATIAAGLVLIAIMGVGIAATITLVAVLGMVARHTTRLSLGPERVARGLRVLEVAGSGAIMVAGIVLFANTLR